MTMREKLAENRGKIIFFAVIIVGIVAFLLLRGGGQILRFREIDIGEIPEYFPRGSYSRFINYYHVNTPRGTHREPIDIFNPNTVSRFDGVELYGFRTDYYVDGERVFRSEEDSHVEFSFNLPAAGLYNIHIEYFPVGARGIDIARELRINGEVPFRGADLIVLSRVWGSAAPVRVDSQGNQIRPQQVEHPRWERTYFSDRLGFFTDPYKFFFNEGLNTISLVGINEPLVIRSLTVTPIQELPTFSQFMAQPPYPENTSDWSERIQGEDSTRRSSPSLFPIFDNSSGATDPPSVAIITLNIIGGYPWRIPGQWIEWEVYAPADGLYRISISARQNYNRGVVSTRQISINGEVPFEEVAAVPFRFNNSWELITLQDEEGNDLLFPMRRGYNTIRMYVTLGDLGEIIDQLHASIMRLNDIYRRIIVLTGSQPDPLRDYRVHVRLPEVMDMIYEETALLYGILHNLEEFLGERNEHTGIITTLVRQLDLFHARPDRIPRQLVNFRQNISSFANTARDLTEGPLDIDFIIVSGTGAELPRVRETFFTRASHEIRAFATSFTHDFDAIGDLHDDADDVLTVWITTGRDQATALKTMIDDTFTPESGIPVNMRLVMQPAVLPAVVAGIGPDVLLSMPANTAVEYAFRNASTDLRQFEGHYNSVHGHWVPGFDEVYGRFHESAWVRLRYQRPDAPRHGYFGIPETQHFSLMFYRHDILEELGFDVPESWDDILAMMPVLQRNNMAIGIPPIGNPALPDISGFLTQLYQRGGFLYNRNCEPRCTAPNICPECVNDDLSRTVLDNEAAIEAFEAFTRFFTHFGSPQFFDPANRFRSGEMPIIIANFNMFNTLVVFAPEIYGLWNFGLMPGHDHGEPVFFEGRAHLENEGYYRVHHTVSDWGDTAIIVQQSDMHEEAWEFLTWWTSTETQLRFGREMEAIMGEAARHPTANMEAFRSLPWSSSQLDILDNQRNWILGTPEVPGGYYVHRQMINIIRRVVHQNLDTRETLLDVQIVINRELINKRREFGLEQ